MRGWWRNMHPRARQQRFEMLVGIAGTFVFFAFVNALVLEIQHKPALVAALVLLVCLLLFGLAYRGWQRSKLE